MENYRFIELVNKENGFEFYQAFADEVDWVKDRKPRLVENSHPHYHYVYGMGDKALDVSQAYGVSIGYSDLKDPVSAFHLRYLYTGKDVEIPK